MFQSDALLQLIDTVHWLLINTFLHGFTYPIIHRIDVSTDKQTH